MDNLTHIRLWVALTIACLLINPFYRRGNEMADFVLAEVAMTSNTFGPRIGKWILASSDAVLAYSPAYGISKLAKAGSTSEAKAKEIESGVLNVSGRIMVTAANQYFHGLQLSAYVMCLRLLILVVWFGMLSPIIIATLLDGLSQRAIKRTNFDPGRPAAFSILSHMVLPIVMAPLLYLTIPISVSPTLIPLWLFVGILPMSMLISNTQPVFAKN
jgi:hypothetical protein